MKCVSVFHPLGHEQLHRITEDQIRYLRERLATRDPGLTLTPAALDKLAEAGFEPAHGAHPHKRAIQPQNENPLAQKIMAGDTIRVDINDDVISLRQGIGAQEGCGQLRSGTTRRHDAEPQRKPDFLVIRCFAFSRLGVESFTIF